MYSEPFDVNAVGWYEIGPESDGIKATDVKVPGSGREVSVDKVVSRRDMLHSLSNGPRSKAELE